MKSWPKGNFVAFDSTNSHEKIKSVFIFQNFENLVVNLLRGQGQNKSQSAHTYTGLWTEVNWFPQ